MSASSTTSVNYLIRNFSSSSGLTLAGWCKPNSFTKSGYDELACLQLSGTNLIGFQQDPAGSGTASKFVPFWYNGSMDVGPDAITSSGVWFYLALVVSGSVMTAYWSTESGAFSSWTSGTMPFSATTLTSANLADDFADERADASYRGWGLWTAALSQSELEAERASSGFTPVRTSNLDSYLPLANGTNPGVASSGGDWTASAGWVDDSSNPTPPGGAKSYPRRSKGLVNTMRNSNFRR